MAWAGYSCFTLDFALIKEDLLCSAPLWEEWEHSFVPEAAHEHSPARVMCQQNKCPGQGSSSSSHFRAKFIWQQPFVLKPVP